MNCEKQEADNWQYYKICYTLLLWKSCKINKRIAAYDEGYHIKLKPNRKKIA